MKKILLLGLLASEAISYTSPNCMEHLGPRFRKSSLEKISCNCPCRSYPRAGHADGYKCLVCNHALLPEEFKTPEATIVALKTLPQLKKEMAEESNRS